MSATMIATGTLTGATGTIPLPAPGYGGIATETWNSLLNVCYTDGVASISVLQLDSSLNQKGAVSFTLPPGNVMCQQDASVVATTTPLDANGETDLLVFVPSQLTPNPWSMLNTIFYASVKTGALKPLGGATSPLRFGQLAGQPCHYALAATDFGVTLLSYNLFTQAVTMYFFPWDGLDSMDSVTQVQFPGTPAYEDIVGLSASYALAPGLSPTGEQNLSFVMVGATRDAGNNPLGLLAVEIPVQFVDGVPQVTPSQISWGSIPYLASVFNLSVDKGAVGRLFVYLTSYDASTLQFRSFLRTAPDTWTDEGAPLAPIQSNPPYACLPVISVGYIPGAVTVSPSKVNPRLTDATQPIARMLLSAVYGYHSANSSYSQLVFVQDTFGSVTRRALPKVKPAKKILLGIIEGPPPIPVENMNLDKKWDNRNPASVNLGTAAVSTGIDQTASVTIDAFAAIVTKIEAESEGVAGAFEFSVGYGAVKETSSRITSNTLYSVAMTTQTVTNNGVDLMVPQPNGQAFLLGADATGFTYEFVDADGNTPPGSIGFVQIIPLNPHVSVLPYVMNPHQTPYPGQLLSYVLDQDERDALAALSVLQFDTGSGTQPYISSAWSAGGGKVTQSYASYDSQKFTTKVKMDAKALVGPAFDGECLGKGKALFGLAANLELKWSSDQSKQVGLATDVGTLGNIHAPHSYTSFSYDTYHLKENPTWASDLQAALLVRDSSGNIIWPTDPHELATNQALSNMIGDGSAPWKITYALDTYQFNYSLREVLDDSSLAADLERAGITTTGALETLIDENEPTYSFAGTEEIPGRINSDPELKQTIREVLQRAKARALKDWRASHPGR